MTAKQIDAKLIALVAKRDRLKAELAETNEKITELKAQRKEASRKAPALA